MKVYIRRWKAEQKNFVREEPFEIDAYNGVGFTDLTEKFRATERTIKGKVQTIYLHASEPNALVVYVEDVE